MFTGEFFEQANLLGRPPAVAVGMGGRQVCKGAQYGDVFDHHAVEFTYDDGLKLFAQDRQISGCWADMSEWVHGDEGTCELRQSRHAVTAVTTPTNSNTMHLSMQSEPTNPTTRANWLP